VPFEKTTMRQHVLVVEDEIDQRELTREILEAYGHTVRVASNGQEALNQLLASERPALILLDLTMPVMSGREFLNAISSSFPHLANIPVAVVSAVTDFADLENRYSSVVAIIKKPLQIERLQAIAEQFAGQII
jgi:CheY-like chemotaxis protein